MKPPVQSEADLAARIVAYYKARSFEVFEEVQPRGWGSGKRADIVAVKGEILHVVECKKALSFDVLAQCAAWSPYASTVFAGVAFAKTSPGREMAMRCAQSFGIGVYEVKSLWPTDRGADAPVILSAGATERGRFDPRLLRELRPEHQTSARAGTPGGGQATRFKEIVAGLVAFARLHPGDTLRNALSVCDHDWPSIAIGIERLLKLRDEVARLGLLISLDPAGVARVHAVEIGGGQ